MMGEQRPFVSMTLLDGAPVLASPARLFQTRIFGSGRYEDGQYWNYAVAPDGRFLLNTLLDGEGSPGPLTLIQHWTPATR